MTLIDDSQFTNEWLHKKDFDPVEVAKNLAHQLDYHNKRRRAESFHKWLFVLSNTVKSQLGPVYLPKEFKSVYGETIIRLPAQQVLRIWGLFLAEEITDKPVANELFAWFLDHVRIVDDSLPATLLPKEEECLQKTRELLENSNMDSLEGGHLNKVLQLALSWGNLILLKYSYQDEKWIKQWKSVRWDNLAPIHDYYDGSKWKAIVAKCTDPDAPLFLVKTVLQLLVQKISILSKSLFDEKDEKMQEINRKNLGKVVSKVLKMIQDQPHFFPLLDVWRLAAVTPEHQASDLTEIFVEGLMSQGSEIDPGASTLIINLSERPVFVHAIICSIIRYCKKFLPRESPLSKLFNGILETEENSGQITGSSLLSVNEVLKQNYSQLWQDIHELKPMDTTLPKQNLLSVLKLFDFIPLGYLPPDSHIKCTLFLSSLLFTTEPTKKSGKVLKITTKHLVSILKGVRFFWSFDFTKPVDLVQKVIAHLVEGNGNLDYFSELLSSILAKGFKDSRLTIKSINPLFKLAEKVSDNPALHLLLSTIILEEVNIRILRNKKFVSKLTKDDKFWNNSKRLVESLFNQLDQVDFSDDMASHNLHYKALICILEHKAKIPNLDHDKDQLKTICKKLIKQSCSQLTHHRAMSLSQSKQCLKLLTYLCMHMDDVSGNVPSKFFNQLWMSIFPYYPEIPPEMESDDQIGELEPEEFRESAELISALSRELLRSIPSSDFESYIDYTLTLLKGDSSLVDVFLILQVYKGFFLDTPGPLNCKFYEDKNRFMDDTAIDKILIALLTIMKEQNLRKIDQININLIEAVLDLIKCILHCGKSMMTSPRIYLCLQTLIFTPLRTLIDYPDKLTKAFTSLYAVSNEILLQYEFTATSCMVVINDMVLNFMQILIQVSEQDRFVNYDEKVQKEIETCASNFNKLITLLTNVKEAFSQYAPHLITSYISCNHQITIHPLIKRHLILCVYRLLNVIKSCKNWLPIYEMIHCRLDESGREILKILYDNYEKYYVFKGRF